MVTLTRVRALLMYSLNCRTLRGCSRMAKAISLKSAIPMKNVRQ